jgi:hypothetical protein
LAFLDTKQVKNSKLVSSVGIGEKRKGINDKSGKESQARYHLYIRKMDFSYFIKLWDPGFKIFLFSLGLGSKEKIKVR